MADQSQRAMTTLLSPILWGHKSVYLRVWRFGKNAALDGWPRQKAMTVLTLPISCRQTSYRVMRGDSNEMLLSCDRAGHSLGAMALDLWPTLRTDTSLVCGNDCGLSRTTFEKRESCPKPSLHGSLLVLCENSCAGVRDSSVFPKDRPKPENHHGFSLVFS